MMYLDLKNQTRPDPVLNTRRKILTMEEGEHLKIDCTDPFSVRDIPKYCQISGNHLVMASKQNNIISFEIEKGKVSP